MSYILAKGLNHITWVEVISSPCNSELEEYHINWKKIISKYQNFNGTPAFKEYYYISKNEENIADTEVFIYIYVIVSKDIFRNHHNTRPPKSLILFPKKYKFLFNNYR